MARAHLTIPALSVTQLERFWSRVDKRDPCECWPWTGCDMRGYGVFHVGKKMYLATRVMWMLTNGEIGDGLFACHHCDNPPCVNPAHLFLGTHQDNMADRNRKGRAHRGPRANIENIARGEAVYGAKLTPELVREIRAVYAAGGVTQRQLARRYGMAQCPIRHVIIRKTWKHVA